MLPTAGPWSAATARPVRQRPLSSDASLSIIARIDTLPSYSLTAARLAQHLVPNVELADDAFTAGLLHEVGVLVLALNHPALSLEVDRVAAQRGCTLVEAEKTLGASHAQVGAALLAAWQVPFPIASS